jgi:hypothetical protein
MTRQIRYRDLDAVATAQPSERLIIAERKSHDRGIGYIDGRVHVSAPG